jgi:hypothetical protein
MNAQEFAIAHGEKVLVVVITGLCGWMLSNTFSNQDIRPRDISVDRIAEMVGKVEKVRGEIAPPVLKAPSNYLEDMKARWAIDLPSNEYMAWLSTTIDVGPPDVDVLRAYIYELHAPQVTVRDNIGSFEVTVALPGAKRASGDARISDAAKQEWALERHEKNSAERLGVLIEYKVAGGEFRPVTAKEAPNGFVPAGKEGANGEIKLTVDTAEAWQLYTFRARLVAKATGLPLDKKVSNDQQQTVLVFQGAYDEDPVDWTKLTKAIVDQNKSVLERFIPGTTEGIGASQLKPGEKLYTSAYGNEQTIIGTSPLRFVFEKPLLNPEDPMKTGAVFRLTKLVSDNKGNRKWLFEPEHFKVMPEQPIGEKDKKVLDPHKMKSIKDIQKIFRQEDLSTPFTLVEVKTEVKRILFYELQFVTRPNGGKAKDLKLTTKENLTEVAVVLNTQTGVKTMLPACERITKPGRANAIIYPDFKMQTFSELDEFNKSPTTFRSWGLTPPAPIPHEPGTGPLEDMRKKQNDPLLATDTIYYELPDGRLVFFEHVNAKPTIVIRPGSEAAQPPKVEEKPAEEQPRASETPPAKPGDKPADGAAKTPEKAPEKAAK